MPEQPSARSKPQTHTTATLKSVLQTTTQVLSTLPPPTSPLHTLDHHQTLKRHIHTLLHLIQASLTAHKAALTQSLTLSQQRLKNLSESLSTVTGELSHLLARRARTFSRSAHLLSRLVSPSAARAPAPSLLPFLRPAAPRAAPEKARARAEFAACARELRECDESVRFLRRTEGAIGRGAREARVGVEGGLSEVRRAVREAAGWRCVLLALGVVDDGFEDFRNTRGRGVWEVVCGRWARVGEAVRGVAACDRLAVESADAVVQEIASVLMELRMVP